MIELPYLPPPLPDARQYPTGRFIAAGVILLVLAAIGGCFSAVMPVGYVAQTRQAARYQAMAAHATNATPGSVTYPVYATPSPARPNVLPPGYASPSTSPATPPTTAYSGTTVPANFYNRPQPQAMPVSQLVMTIGIYLAFTVGCMWLGIAALRKRRYVRPLLIILSTHGIIFGSLMCIGIGVGLGFAMTQINAINTAGSGSPPLAAVTIGIVVGGLFAVVVILVPPIVLLILMRPDAVRETAEFYDLKPRWTDGLPLRILGLVLTLAVFAVFELFALGRPMLPMLTHFITGFPAGALIVAHAAVVAWAAVRVYRREAFGWTLGFWVIVGPMLFFLASSVLIPTERYFDTIRDQPATVELMQDHALAFRALSTGSTLVLLAAFVIYMLRVRPLVTLPAAEPGPRPGD